MRYIAIRLSCLLRGHQWRQTTSPFGVYERCRRCCSSRAPAGRGQSLADG